MLIDLEVVEKFVVDKLEPVVSPLLVEPFPDRPGEYEEHLLQSATGVVLVMVRTGDLVLSHEGFEIEPDEIDAAVLRVWYNIVTPGLRGDAQHVGAYTVIKQVVDTMHRKRFVIAGEPFKSMGVRFLFGRYFKKGGFWQYAVESRLEPVMVRNFR